MADVRIIVVSDSHLSPSTPSADEQWSAVVAEVHRRQPDLVVHTGDISLDGTHDRNDLVHARRLLDRLPVRWRAIPGNHDIGDLGDDHDAVDDERRQRYDDVLGARSWVEPLGDWRLIGLDVQTLASPGPEGTRLWAWLDEASTTPCRTVLFLHRPVLPHDVDEFDDPRRYLPGATRRRLLELIDERQMRVVVSGHVHQWRTTRRNHCRHVWAPSTWASLPDRIQPVIGTKVTGIVELVLGEGDDVEPTSRLVRPPGMGDLVIGDDFASPYDH